MTDKSYEEYDMKSFQDLFENKNFADAETALANSKKSLAKVLVAMENKGFEEVSVLTRRIEKVHADTDGITKKLYNIELSFHVPGQINDIIMYDASLVTYYLGNLKHKEPEVIYITGSSQEGEVLSRYSLEDIEDLVRMAIDKGDNTLALKISCTWNVYHKYAAEQEEAEAQ